MPKPTHVFGMPLHDVCHLLITGTFGSYRHRRPIPLYPCCPTRTPSERTKSAHKQKTCPPVCHFLPAFVNSTDALQLLALPLLTITWTPPITDKLHVSDVWRLLLKFASSSCRVRKNKKNETKEIDILYTQSKCSKY